MNITIQAAPKPMIGLVMVAASAGDFPLWRLTITTEDASAMFGSDVALSLHDGERVALSVEPIMRVNIFCKECNRRHLGMSSRPNQWLRITAGRTSSVPDEWLCPQCVAERRKKLPETMTTEKSETWGT